MASSFGMSHSPASATAPNSSQPTGVPYLLMIISRFSTVALFLTAAHLCFHKIYQAAGDSGQTPYFNQIDYQAEPISTNSLMWTILSYTLFVALSALTGSAFFFAAMLFATGLVTEVMGVPGAYAQEITSSAVLATSTVQTATTTSRNWTTVETHITGDICYDWCYWPSSATSRYHTLANWVLPLAIALVLLSLFALFYSDLAAAVGHEGRPPVSDGGDDGVIGGGFIGLDKVETSVTGTVDFNLQEYPAEESSLSTSCSTATKADPNPQCPPTRCPECRENVVGFIGILIGLVISVLVARLALMLWPEDC